MPSQLGEFCNMPEVGLAIATFVANYLGVTAPVIIEAMAFVINAGLVAGVSTLAAKSLAPSASDLASQMDTGINSIPYKKFVYGETRVGGDMVFMTTSRRYWQNGASLKAGDKEDQLLHMVIEVAGHEIESFTNPITDTEVYIGDEKLTLVAVSQTSLVDMYPGKSSTDTNGHTRYVATNRNYNPDSTVREARLMFKFYKGDEGYADADLMAAMGFSSDSWDATKIGDGRAYVVVRAYYDPSTFQGMPKFTFKLKGKNDIYDPRTSTSGYSTNPALIMADYLSATREEGGIGESYDEINDTVLQASANICDENVTILADSTTQKRYFLNGQFSSMDSPDSVMAQILNTMAGWMERVNGSWHINAGAYTAPAMTLTESEMRAHAQTSLNRGYRDMYNSVRPVLRAPETEWLPGNAKPVEALERIDVTPDHTTETFTATAHGLSNGDRVQFHRWSGTTIDDDNLPAGISKSTWYYVINATTNTFQVSLTAGGVADTFSSNGSSNVFCYYDAYLTKDTERKIQDIVFTLVSDQTLARRLALISLLQSRMEVTASLKCKIGTAFACPLDLKVGDSVRWIDAHKGFWEYVGSVETKTWQGAGTINFTAHGYLDGQPVVITDNGATDQPELTPYYVTEKTADTFKLAEWRGGPAITTGTTSAIQFRTIQGKLFRVAGWKQTTGSDGIPGVDQELVETNSAIYTWQSGYEEAPETQSSITVANPSQVEAPDGLAASSGTAVLYTRLDGTIGSRVKLTWDANTDAYVDNGKVETQYRPAFSKTFTVTHATDIIDCTAHGLAVDDIVRFSTTGSLPGGLDADEYYYVYSVTADTFQIAEYKGATSAIDITAATGSGTHSVQAPDFNWTSVADIPASVTETYIADLQDGEDYDFRIRFRNAMGQPGPWGYIYNHTFVGKSAAPAVPTSFSATPGEGRVVISFAEATDLDLAGTEIWRKESSGSYELIFTAPKGSSKYIDRTAIGFDDDNLDGTQYSYSYKARSVDTTGNQSSYTTEDTGNQITIPSAPAGVSAVGNFGFATVSWSISGDYGQMFVSLHDADSPYDQVNYRIVPVNEASVAPSSAGNFGNHFFRLRYIYETPEGRAYGAKTDSNTINIQDPTA